MFGKRVMSTGLDGQTEVVGEFDDLTSGLGFLSDGSLLVVLRRRRQILRFDGAGWGVHADLTDIPGSWLNDMVVGPDDRAYVDSTVRPGSGDEGDDCIVVVEPDGTHRVATTQVSGPNGLAITGDGSLLICANTHQELLLEFPIARGGDLGPASLYATTAPVRPDGICLDDEGCVWVGGVHSGRFDRVMRGGGVAHSIATTGRWAVACVLGGPDRRTLFMATAVTTAEKLFAVPPQSDGYIEVERVAVAGAGWP
jgi:sugar lactone lactonase YvrE